MDNQPLIYSIKYNKTQQLRTYTSKSKQIFLQKCAKESYSMLQPSENSTDPSPKLCFIIQKIQL